MLQEYADLVRAIKTGKDWKPGLSFEVGPDDRYYLTGSITHPDLSFCNQMGFDNWAQADKFASDYGYLLDWEVLRDRGGFN